MLTPGGGTEMEDEQDMELTFSHQTLQIQGEPFTRNRHWMPTEGLRLPNRQENLLVTRWDRRRKKRKESEWGLRPREGALEEGRFLHPGASPHQWEGQTGWERGFRGQSTASRWLPGQDLPLSVQGELGAEDEASGGRPREKNAVGCAEEPAKSRLWQPRVYLEEACAHQCQGAVTGRGCDEGTGPPSRCFPRPGPGHWHSSYMSSVSRHSSYRHPGLQRWVQAEATRPLCRCQAPNLLIQEPARGHCCKPQSKGTIASTWWGKGQQASEL